MRRYRLALLVLALWGLSWLFARDIIKGLEAAGVLPRRGLVLSDESDFAFSLVVLAAMLGLWALWRVGVALGGRARPEPTAEIEDSRYQELDRQKEQLLRDLKELEFDRDLRKISPEDYAGIAERLRREATALLKALDEVDPVRLYGERIRQDLGAFLEQVPAAPPKDAAALDPIWRRRVLEQPLYREIAPLVGEDDLLRAAQRDHWVTSAEIDRGDPDASVLTVEDRGRKERFTCTLAELRARVGALAVALCLLVPGLAAAFPGMEKTSAPKEGGQEHDLSRKGTVRIAVKRPDGKPAAGIGVSLVVTVDGAPRDRLEAKADGAGRATFRVPRGEHVGYTAIAAREGVNYYARVQMPSGKTEAEGVLTVAAKTREPAALRVSRIHLIVDPGKGGVRVTEVVVVHNGGTATYAGEPISVPLFHGAQNLRAEGSPGGSYELDGHDLRYRGYLRPGETQLQYEYDLPLTGSFERKTRLAVERVVVILTRADFRFGGPLFKDVRKMTRNEVSFLSAQAGPVAAGGSIAFEIAPPAGMMAASAGGGSPEGTEKKGELVKDWRVVAKWLAPLLTLFIFFVAIYLASRREGDDLGVADDAALAALRERLLAELAAATRRAAAGEKAAARRERDLTRRLADLYRVLDERAARRAAEAGKGAR